MSDVERFEDERALESMMASLGGIPTGSAEEGDWTEVFEAVAQWLGRADAMERSRAACRWALSNDPRLRALSIYVVGRNPGMLGAPTIIGHLLDDPDPRVRAAARALDRAAETGGICTVPLELATVCEQLARELARWKPERPVIVSGHRPLVGNWEPGSIHRMLRNLLDNAVEHGAGQVNVELERGQAAIVRVCCSGPPIIPEPREKLWQGQERGGELALSFRVAMEAAARHGGKLSIRRELEDNVFEVFLPLRPRCSGH